MTPVGNPPHDAKIVFLIGLRGSGKSTVGRELAARLDLRWFDSDDEIERETGRSVASIFALQGEPAFREIEMRCIKKLIESIGAEKRTDSWSAVVSLGGGAVLPAETRSLMARSGLTIWLDGDATELVRRLQNDPAPHRPPLTDLEPGDEVRRLKEERFPVYSECADFRVDTTSLPTSRVVESIVNWLAGTDR